QDEGGGGRRVSPERATDLEPAHVGQLDVEDNQVGLAIGQTQRFVRRGGLADLELRLAEDSGGEPPADLVVVYEEEGGGWAVGHGCIPRCESRCGITSCWLSTAFLFVWHPRFGFSDSGGTKCGGRPPRDEKVVKLYEGELPGTTGQMISPGSRKPWQSAVARQAGSKASAGPKAGTRGAVGAAGAAVELRNLEKEE